MFWLGVLVGVVLACGVLWLLYGPDGALRASGVFDPRHDVSSIERQTISQMLAAEMAMRSDAQGEADVVQGTAHEITRRP